MKQSAGHPDHRVEEIHDDLEANALYLADDSTRVLFVTCDLGVLETDRIKRYTIAMGATAGLDPDAIIIGCSHTHGSPVVLHTSYQKPVDEAYSERLQAWLCTLAKAAVDAAKPARIGWGFGSARLGYNRRVCYADGTHEMYRRPERDAEFTGVEGPEDTECLAFAVFDEHGNLQAVLHHGTGHPGSWYSEQALSAEFPGVARRLVREAYGPIPVLFYNGALGDIAMMQQTHPQATPDNKEAQVIRLGAALAGETLRLIHEMVQQADLTLRHCRRELDFPVRLPSEDAVARGKAVIARMDAGEQVTGMEAILAWGPVSLMEQFGENPVDRLPFHALRIGDMVLATQPFELFCQYQIDLKRRSPFRQTAWFGVSGGYGGYLPTMAATLGGGYSALPFSWTRFSPEVGYQVVDAVAGMLHELWNVSNQTNLKTTQKDSENVKTD